MSLKEIPPARLCWTGISTGIAWGLINLVTMFFFQNRQLEGSPGELLLSFTSAGAIFSLFIVFLAAWFSETARKNPYSTLIKISLLVWFISLFFGGIASRYDPERYHFDWTESLWGGVKVTFLGALLGWRIRRLVR